MRPFGKYPQIAIYPITFVHRGMYSIMLVQYMELPILAMLSSEAMVIVGTTMAEGLAWETPPMQECDSSPELLHILSMCVVS